MHCDLSCAHCKCDLAQKSTDRGICEQENIPAYRIQALVAKSSDCIVTDPPAPMTLLTTNRDTATAALEQDLSTWALTPKAFCNGFIPDVFTMYTKNTYIQCERNLYHIAEALCVLEAIPSPAS